MRLAVERAAAVSLCVCLGVIAGLQNRVVAAPVVINEFMAINTKTIYDEDYQFDDWIELYNDSAGAVNLGGYYMSDVSSEPMKWRIPTGTTIAGKGRLLVWADGTSPANPARPLHASFKINGEDGEIIALYATNGATTADVVRFGQQAADVSYGRLSDNWPTWGPFNAATPRMPNSGYAPPPSPLAGRLFINEWLTSNSTGIKDPSGKREDWLELYNSSVYPIDLGGLYLTDNLTNPDKFPIPAANVIGPRGFALFWADKDKKEGPTHTNFKLSDAGGDIGLFDKDGVARIDVVLSYGRQQTDVSQGRQPDGSAIMVTLAPPSPRESNVPRPAHAVAWELYR
jgi:hypothetical protein